MLPSSPAFRAAALTSAPTVYKAWIQRQGHVQFGPDRLHLASMQVNFDEFAASRRTLSASVFDPEGTLRPRFATDALAPFGNEMVLHGGLVLPSGVAEYVPLGVYRLEATDDAEGMIRVEGFDRSVVIAAALNEIPYVIAADTTLDDAIGDYLEAKYPGIVFFPDPASASLVIPSTLVFEEGTASGDPWKNMRDLALLFGREVFIDAWGQAIMRPIPTQVSGPYSAVYEPGELNMAISTAVRLDPRGVRNVIKVIGEGSGLSASVSATAEVDDPDDPLYAGTGGVFGRRPEIIKSSAVASVGQAQDAADAILVQRKGVSENVTLQLVPILSHEPGDIVLYRSDRDVVSGVFALSRWTLDVTLRSAMSVATRVLRAPVGTLVQVAQARAGVASAAGVANNATGQPGRHVFPTTATATGTANDPDASVAPVPASATAAGVANDPQTPFAFAEAPAVGTGTANNATTTVKPSAGVAPGTGAAQDPDANVGATVSGLGASATGTANDATAQTGVSLVQKKFAGALTATFDSAPTQGNKLVLVFGRNGAGRGDVVETPTGWTRLKDRLVTTTSERGAAIFCKEAGAGESATVTVSNPGGSDFEIHIYEYSGLVDTDAVDQSSSGSSGGSAVLNLTTNSTGTTTQANELIIAACVIAGAAFGRNPTMSNSFTRQSDIASSDRLSSGDRIVAATGTYSTVFDWSGTGGNAGYSVTVIATIKAAS